MAIARGPVDLAEVKGRHPLGDVVEASGIRLKGKGRVRQGVCLFHDEGQGSFTVYADTQRFHCFGCGASGDVLDFIQRTEGLSLPEAIRWLGGGDGLALPGLGPLQTGAGHQGTGTTIIPPRDPAVLSAAVRFYAGQLHRSATAQRYLASRGIGPTSARRLGLGYAPGHGLREHLESLGFAPSRVQDSGLLFEKGGERFAGTAVVPDIADGRVRWLAGRAIDPDRSPRFQSLPGTKPVLGLGRLGLAQRWLVVTEGLFDWLALTQWGLPSCAALGTQGMVRVAPALRGCSRVVIAFDSDDAGREASHHLKELLGRRAAIVTLPQGVTDVAELATMRHGRALFRRLLARAASTTW